LLLFVLFALAPLAYVYVTNRSIKARDDLAGFLGTWTDETGPEGNFITFGEVRRPAPGPIPGLELVEGTVVCHDFLDGNEGEASWGYEHWKPLRLNITFAGRNRIAAVKAVDRDHLMIRFVEDLPFDRRHDVFRSPEARLLTRVPAGAEPPQADRKDGR
jgi:hypothetical protein